MAVIYGLRPRIYLGKADSALQRNLELAPQRYLKLFCLAYLDRATEAFEMLEQFAVRRPGIGTIEDESSAWQDILYLEAAVLVGHHQAAEPLLHRFAGSQVRTSGVSYTTCVARHLGAAAALLGRPDEARAYYKDALELATKMRFRPEVALTRLQLAALLLEHYPDERAEALEHLDFATAEFREMKMQPSLERALTHKEILRA